MTDEGLLTISYDTSTKAVTLVYEDDAPYSIQQIIAYVDDMTESNSQLIMVFEGAKMMHHMRKIGDEWKASKET